MEESEEVPPYVLLVTATGKSVHRSRDFTGHGTAQYPVVDDLPRESYTGDFQDGIRFGSGVYSYSTGSRYKGRWVENRKSGLGRAKYLTKVDDEENPRSDVSEYHGDFHDGLKHGQGSFHYANGDIYSGQWSSGKKHGNGTYYFAADASKIVGVWKNGEIQSGAWTLANGVVWTGQFDLGQPCGLGRWQFPNGENFTGEFVQTVETEDLESNEDGSVNQRRILKSVVHLSH